MADNPYNNLSPQCESVTLAAGEQRQLPDRPCKFVQILNWTTNAGTTSATGVPTSTGAVKANEYTGALGAASSLPAAAVNGSEIYYGFGGILCGQIFAGESTDLIPCTNLNQICVKPGAGGGREIFYAWWN